MTLPVAILRTGAVTSVGLDAPSTCAALRVRLNNFYESTFLDERGEPIVAAAVDALGVTACGSIERQQWMLIEAVRECLSGLPQLDLDKIAILLCVAELSRPGRPAQLEERLRAALEGALGCTFAPQSLQVAYGQAGAAFALERAFELLATQGVVLIAGVDSYLGEATMRSLLRDRMHGTARPDGFIPGEAACALLVGRPAAARQIRPRFSKHRSTQEQEKPGFTLFCTSLGGAREAARPGAAAPNRARALAAAVQAATAALPGKSAAVGLRISTQSSEDFYAKEFALAATRSDVAATPLWMLADSLGETGAAAGLLALAWAYGAAHKQALPDTHALCLMASDEGERAAVLLSYGNYEPEKKG